MTAAVTSVAAPAPEQFDAISPHVPRPRWHPVALLVVLSACYFSVGTVLMLRYNVFEGDALSRVANAAFTLDSRDPHLSAVGFVWNPLPSLVQIPLWPLSRWWPELWAQGVTGFFQSAAFTAGSALLIRQIAIDRGVGTAWRWLAVACFALNPMTVVHGGLGMSEAAEVFCTLWSVRYLLRWVDSDRISDLTWAGIAFGVGYLVRYELLPAAVGAASLVAVVALIRSPRDTRLQSSILSVMIVAFPITSAVAIWAVTGWIVNGQLFATMSSQYGNTSQVAVAVARGEIGNSGDWWLVAERISRMQPFVGIAIILAVVLSVVRRNAAALVPVATFGAVLAFSGWGQFSATTFGWFRFYILAIPLVIVVALVCWVPAPRTPGWWKLESLPSKLGAALLVASLTIGAPLTARAMLDPRINDGNQVMLFFNAIVDPVQYPPDEQWFRRAGNDERLVADYLDRQHLPDTSVLMDTFMAWGVWLDSDNRKQFVITSDYDFRVALNRPWEYGIRYIVVTNPAGNAAPDAITKRYPTIWADGAGVGTLAYSAAGPFDEERWRLYRVTKPPLDETPPNSPELAQPGG